MADTVIPAYNPRYAFAAPNTIARKTPTNMDLIVSSGIVLSPGMNELNSSLEGIQIKYKLRHINIYCFYKNKLKKYLK